jgi:hypothetical protein
MPRLEKMEELPYPVASRLRDIFTDLLGRETQRTDLGGKRRRGTNLTTGCPEVAARKYRQSLSRSKTGSVVCVAYMIFISLGSTFGAAQIQNN